jgi:4-oxalocrotonate tautomerase family enzyme
MPNIEVLWFEGRDQEMKKKLVEDITNSFVNITGCKAKAVNIIFKEVDKKDTAAGGELLA